MGGEREEVQRGQKIEQMYVAVGDGNDIQPRGFQDPTGMTLSEIPSIGERKPVETISRVWQGQGAKVGG